MVVSVFFLPESLSKALQQTFRNSTLEQKGMVHDIKRSFKVSYFVLLLLIFTMTFGLANFETIFGLYVSEKYQYTPKDISIIMTIAALIGVIIQALLVDKLLQWFDEIRVINVCFILSALTMVLILLTGNFLFMLIINILFILFTSMLGSIVMCVVWNQKARQNSDFVSILSGQK
jgi:MFS transporter, DHA1 family, multidrug resistance protein